MGSRGEGRRSRRIRQESLPDLPQITFAVFCLKRKFMSGEVRLVAVGLAWRAVWWLLGPGTSQVLLIAAAADQSIYEIRTWRLWVQCGSLASSKGTTFSHFLPIYSSGTSVREVAITFDSCFHCCPVIKESASQQSWVYLVPKNECEDNGCFKNAFSYDFFCQHMS